MASRKLKVIYVTLYFYWTAVTWPLLTLVHVRGCYIIQAGAYHLLDTYMRQTRARTFTCFWSSPESYEAVAIIPT